MSEFIGERQVTMRASDAVTADGMNAFGKPVPSYRRTAGLAHARQMGIIDTNQATATIDRMCEAIRRDQPYEAMEAGMAYLDLTGTYRLLSVLCAAEKPRVRVKARRT